MVSAAVQRRARDETWGELGPAMRALPRESWRTFVVAYCMAPTGYGANVDAFRKAGLDKGYSQATASSMAWQLLQDERIIAAIGEEARKMLRAGAPAAAKALLNLISNPDHRDHGRAIGMVLARTDPEVQRIDQTITHRVINPDEEALEELRAARALGADRAKLISLFGENYFPKLERLEAQQAEKAKVIDGEVVEGGSLVPTTIE